ncbi:MAG: mechanosensitive ion channel family protein [Candidatus Amulumruptor caecigallinarius]|nr:mechanosensitive ion channel family protein [Candidatus Amulumruptor caecigallinarius]MCM1397013.1 mechanosensitive ion channel family protein [Candidatus Amulumruptor caecigallinarius]MCM1454050.1 mechanosensitive ion channel family protein [bacterium]
MTLPFILVPTHKAALWFMVRARRLFDLLGLEHDRDTEEWLYILLAAFVAITLGWIVRKSILWSVQKVVTLRHTTLGPELVKSHLLTKCSHMIPPLVMLSLVPLALLPGTVIHDYVVKFLIIYAIVTTAAAASAVITFVWVRYDTRQNTRNLPLKGVASMLKGLVWIVAIIVIVSVLIDRSPITLLTGLGAFAAVLMLIFKDSLLGLVASIQISQNDMVRIGDWITMPGTPINGRVFDMSLSTVKVRNFDNTIITCPPYKLVQGTFQNWRGMYQSGARRMYYNLVVCNDSIIPADDDFIKKVTAEHPSLADWISAARKESTGALYTPGSRAVNGSTGTNLGLYRAYICDLLMKHPHVSTEQLLLVRLMPPTDQGTTLNIYFFTDSTEWATYEAVTSQVLEDITAAAPSFSLRLYSPITGSTDPAPSATPTAFTSATPT